jgi:hypothetical protein
MLSFSSDEFLDTIHFVADDDGCGGDESGCRSSSAGAMQESLSSNALPSGYGVAAPVDDEDDFATFSTVPGSKLPGVRHGALNVTASHHARKRRRNEEISSPHATIAADSRAQTCANASSPSPSSCSSSSSSLLAGMPPGGCGMMRCSVNKKNRYRSWVYNRVNKCLPPQCYTLGQYGLQQQQQSLVVAGTYKPLAHPLCHPSPSDDGPRKKSRTKAEGRATQSRACSLELGTSARFQGSRIAIGNTFHSSTCREGFDSIEQVHELIYSYVWDVLCSSKWDRSIQMERERMYAKKKSVAGKSHRFGNASSLSPSPPESGSSPQSSSYCKMVRQSFNADRMASARATLSERQRICEWCVDMIYRHMRLMNAMCKGVITEAKLRSAAIGLLYMLRQGIVVHELVVLPKLRRLENILPLENHLDVLFGVRAKCITETENVVKIILRSVTKQQLLDAGVAEISCMLS